MFSVLIVTCGSSVYLALRLVPYRCASVPLVWGVHPHEDAITEASVGLALGCHVALGDQIIGSDVVDALSVLGVVRAVVLLGLREMAW